MTTIDNRLGRLEKHITERLGELVHDVLFGFTDLLDDEQLDAIDALGPDGEPPPWFQTMLEIFIAQDALRTAAAIEFDRLLAARDALGDTGRA